MRADAMLRCASDRGVLNHMPHILAHWIAVSVLKKPKHGSGSVGSNGSSSTGIPTTTPTTTLLEQAAKHSGGMAGGLELLLALANKMEAPLQSHALRAVGAIALMHMQEVDTTMDDGVKTFKQRYSLLRGHYASLHTGDASEGDETFHSDQVLVAAACGGKQVLHPVHAAQIKGFFMASDDITASKMYAIYSREPASDAAAEALKATQGIHLAPLGVCPTKVAQYIKDLKCRPATLYQAAASLGIVFCDGSGSGSDSSRSPFLTRFVMKSAAQCQEGVIMHYATCKFYETLKL